jgi:hypothetical protein
MYLSKSNFIFPRSTLTSSQERTMKKHMLKYIERQIGEGLALALSIPRRARAVTHALRFSNCLWIAR